MWGLQGTAPLTYQWRRTDSDGQRDLIVLYNPATTARQGEKFTVAVSDSERYCEQQCGHPRGQSRDSTRTRRYHRSLPGADANFDNTSLQASGGHGTIRLVVIAGQLPNGVSCHCERNNDGRQRLLAPTTFSIR